MLLVALLAVACARETVGGTPDPDHGSDGARPPDDDGQPPPPPPDGGDDEPEPDDDEPEPGDDDDGDGGSFIQEPDGGGTDIECDIWTEDCPAGEKCMPWGKDGASTWNATKCSPIVPDPKQPGEPCTVVGNHLSGEDDCNLHSICWYVDHGTNRGYCVAFCIGDSSSTTCADPGYLCSVSGDSGFPLCLASCDPLESDCRDTQVCVPTPSGSGFTCAPDFSDDEGQYGDPCEYVNVCDPGLFCANADAVPGCMGSVGCCTQFCRVGAGDDQCEGAPGGQQCLPWWEPGQTPPGYEHVGACAIPW